MIVFFTGFINALGLIVAIGAQNAFVLRQGIRREHVLPIVLICAISDALLMSLGIAGFGVILETMPWLITATRYFGVVFLLAYGFFALKRALKPSFLALNEPDKSTSLKTALLTCLGFTFLNPHVYLDTVILVGSLAQQSKAPWIFGFGAAFSSFTWFFTLGFGAKFLTPLFQKPKAWQVLDALIALTMFSLAIILMR